jgi:hypothetical protein
MSALTTHTFDNQRKGKRKDMAKRNSSMRSKAEKRQIARSLEEDKSRAP